MRTQEINPGELPGDLGLKFQVAGRGYLRSGKKFVFKFPVNVFQKRKENTVNDWLIF